MYNEIVPRHFPIAVRTLETLLKNIANHHHMTLQELLDILDL